MALPQQIKTARITDATLANTIDDAGLGAMEQAIADILGIPVNTNITKALFLVAAGGLKIVKLIDNAADPTVDGEIVMNANDLKVRLGGVVKTLESLASGTRMLFDQDSAPTGWTKETDVNDKVIRIVSGARADGGTWTVAGITVDSHVLAESEMPSHTHDAGPQLLPGSVAGLGVAIPWLIGNSAKGTSTSTGGGGGHVHGLTSDGTWRPLHRDVIVASKD